MVDIAYSEETKLSFKEYSVVIPDGFTSKKGLEGRDFIAWLPSPQDKTSYIEGKITIFAGQWFKDLQVEEQMIPSAFASLAHSIFWQTRLENPFSIFEEEYFIPLGDSYPAGGISAAYGDNTFHYNITIFTKAGAKMLRIQVNDIPYAEREKSDKFAVNWVSKIQLSDPFIPAKQVTDKSFFEGKLTKKLVNDWKTCLEYRSNLIIFIQNNEVTSAVSKVKLDIGTGKVAQTTAISKFKKDLQQILDQSAKSCELLMQETLKALELFSDTFPESMLLIDLYNIAKNTFAETVYSARSADGIVIKSEVKGASLTKTKFRTPAIKKVLDIEKKEKERIAAEKAKRAAEERARIEAEKEAERLRLLEEEKQRKEEEAKRKADYLAVKKECEDRLAEFRKQLNAQSQIEIENIRREIASQITKCKEELASLEAELSLLGFFKFSAKKALKVQIVAWQNKISVLSSGQQVSECELTMNAKSSEAQKKYKKQLDDFFAALFPFEKEFEAAKKDFIKNRTKSGSRETAGSNEEIKDNILGFLGMHSQKKYTISELMDNIPALSDLTAQRVSALIRQLKDDGKIWRTEEKGFAYFQIEGHIAKRYGVAAEKQLQRDAEEAAKKKVKVKEFERAPGMENAKIPSIPDVIGVLK